MHRSRLTPLDRDSWHTGPSTNLGPEIQSTSEYRRFCLRCIMRGNEIYFLHTGESGCVYCWHCWRPADLGAGRGWAFSTSRASNRAASTQVGVDLRLRY